MLCTAIAVVRRLLVASNRQRLTLDLTEKSMTENRSHEQTSTHGVRHLEDHDLYLGVEWGRENLTNANKRTLVGEWARANIFVKTT